MPLDIIYQTTISSQELQAIENYHRQQVRQLDLLLKHAPPSLAARYQAEIDKRTERLRHLDQLSPVS